MLSFLFSTLSLPRVSASPKAAACISAAKSPTPLHVRTRSSNGSSRQSDSKGLVSEPRRPSIFKSIFNINGRALSIPQISCLHVECRNSRSARCPNLDSAHPFSLQHRALNVSSGSICGLQGDFQNIRCPVKARQTTRSLVALGSAERRNLGTELLRVNAGEA